MDGAGVGRAYLLENAGSAAQQRGPACRRSRGVGFEAAAEAGGDFRRGERRAVGELYTFTQPEGPRESVLRDRPARRQRRLDVGGAFAERNERVEDLMRDQRRRAVECGRRLERRGHAGHTDT